MALKGKGHELARWHAEVEARLTDVRREMVDLAIASRDAQGWRWALVAQRSIRGAYQLRWRGASWGHVVWQQVLDHLNEVPPALAQWYHETQFQVQVLNHREQAIRYELRAVDRLANKLMADDSTAGRSVQPLELPKSFRRPQTQPEKVFTHPLEGGNPT